MHAAFLTVAAAIFCVFRFAPFEKRILLPRMFNDWNSRLLSTFEKLRVDPQDSAIHSGSDAPPALDVRSGWEASGAGRQALLQCRSSQWHAECSACPVVGY